MKFVLRKTLTLFFVGEYVNVHPYKVEIGELLKNQNAEFVELFDGKIEMNDDEYVWVKTESQLEELAEILSKEKVFAVDTEQHSLRSFLGFTALIQVLSCTFTSVYVCFLHIYIMFQVSFMLMLVSIEFKFKWCTSF